MGRRFPVTLLGRTMAHRMYPIGSNGRVQWRSSMGAGRASPDAIAGGGRTSVRAARRVLFEKKKRRRRRAPTSQIVLANRQNGPGSARDLQLREEVGAPGGGFERVGTT